MAELHQFDAPVLPPAGVQLLRLLGAVAYTVTCTSVVLPTSTIAVLTVVDRPSKRCSSTRQAPKWIECYRSGTRTWSGCAPWLSAPSSASRRASSTKVSTTPSTCTSTSFWDACVTTAATSNSFQTGVSRSPSRSPRRSTTSPPLASSTATWRPATSSSAPARTTSPCRRRSSRYPYTGDYFRLSDGAGMPLPVRWLAPEALFGGRYSEASEPGHIGWCCGSCTADNPVLNLNALNYTNVTPGYCVHSAFDRGRSTDGKYLMKWPTKADGVSLIGSWYVPSRPTYDGQGTDGLPGELKLNSNSLRLLRLPIAFSQRRWRTDCSTTIIRIIDG